MIDRAGRLLQREAVSGEAAGIDTAVVHQGLKGGHVAVLGPANVADRIVDPLQLVAAVVAAFGRVISEIGISMMLGGNARGFTRTMTTAMALEYDKGEFVLAVALGMVLLTISLAMNILLNYFQGKTSP